MNKVILMGRLTRDPEVRYSQGESALAIARFTLAVDRRGRRQDGADQQTADFISCVAFGKTAEFCSKYYKKGQQVLVEGRIQNRTWEDQNGQKRYATDFVVEQAYFADSRRDGAEGGFEMPSASDASGFITVDDSEDLPF